MAVMGVVIDSKVGLQVVRLVQVIGHDAIGVVGPQDGHVVVITCSGHAGEGDLVPADGIVGRYISLIITGGRTLRVCQAGIIMHTIVLHRAAFLNNEHIAIVMVVGHEGTTAGLLQ